LVFHEELMCLLLRFLESTSANPWLYGLLLFIYSVLAAIILPIPVEFGLFFARNVPWYAKAVVLGLGKAAGAFGIFFLGIKVENKLEKWAKTHRLFQQGLNVAFAFVKYTRWMGLLILLSIPFMPDTLPIYVYGIFNKQGQFLTPTAFVLVNFIAGVARAAIFVFLLERGAVCPPAI
jgi:membrane protein YqaA with SNARE-associated domain